MDWFTAINTVILVGILVGGWLKLAHGDESEGCCAVILLVLAILAAVLTVAVWSAGALFGWWGVPW